MRIVTWNCNSSLSKKLDKLIELKPDVAVVQECEEELSGLPDGASYQWIGHNPRRGLGVISFRGDIKVDQSLNSAWTYFLPINASGFKILAVWAFNHRTGKYGDDGDGYPLSVLPQLDPWLKGSNSLILGDFNNSVIWDKRKGTNNFADIAGRLGEKGFKSAYHEFSGEAYGQESESTFYHTKKRDKSYHIDYCFYPSRVDLVDVQIGTYEDWIEHSDHVPVIVDIGKF